MDDNGDADTLIWTTEYGLPTSVVSEAYQAAFIANYLRTWSDLPGVGPMFFYTTRDRETGSSESEDTFGIVETDWTPKLSAEVIAAWIAGQPLPVPDIPDEPGFSTWLAAAFAAVANTIGAVVDAGIAVTKFVVDAVVDAVRWVVSAAVNTVAWVAGAIFDVVTAVVSGIAGLFQPNSVAVSDSTAAAFDGAAPVAALDSDTTAVAKPAAPAPDGDTARVSDHVADADAPAIEPALAESAVESAAQGADVTEAQLSAEATAPSTESPDPEEPIAEPESDAASVADDGDTGSASSSTHDAATAKDKAGTDKTDKDTTDETAKDTDKTPKDATAKVKTDTGSASDAKGSESSNSGASGGDSE